MPVPKEDINKKACLGTERHACLSTPMMHFILETQILARPSHATGHACATNSSLDVPLSTARAEPSFKLKLWHAQTVQNSTPVLRIKCCLKSRTPANLYNLHGPTSDTFLTYKSRSNPI
ncbi:hypothetical protein JCGZ_22957 [Jatropha curcas]|uniref:Uncharacterized protein n=1 Tax=Jatropha curcas TaxID=180498 RepID=A0A067L8T5_JATCU|nr:hypothetical protein JCGZ_22957 [Jatropha curcas]